MKKYLGFLLLCMLLVGCATGKQQLDNNAKQVSQSSPPITIGFIGPLSGDAAGFGEPTANAMKLAQKEINDAGGILNRPLKIIFEDGKCNGKDAATAATKLTSVDKVNILMSACSGETIAVAPIAERENVILFSSGSGSPDITSAGDYVFRNFPSDASSGAQLANYAIETNKSRVAVLSEITAYGDALRRVLVSALLDQGGDVVIDEQFDEFESDFRSMLTKTKNAAPDAIILISSNPPKFAEFLKQKKQMGIDTPLIANELINSPFIFENVPELAEGIVFVEPAFNENAPAAKRLLELYTATYDYSKVAVPNVYLATAYDAIYILKEAIEGCGVQSDQIKECLYNVTDREGAAGVLSIDENGDALFEYVLKKIEGGSSVNL